MGLFTNKEREKELQKQFRKYKITAKQEGGDDGYCYVVRINGREFVKGLTRSEVNYYKKRALERVLNINCPKEMDGVS